MKKKRKLIFAELLALVLLGTAGASYRQSAEKQPIEVQLTDVHATLQVSDYVVDVGSLDIPEYSGTDFYIVNDNSPFFNENIRNYEGEDFIYLSELDELGRCGTCMGQFAQAGMPQEKRGAIGHIKPSGWHTVKYDKDIIQDMYLYNRCHLLMYAISGLNEDARNLITGTRQFNLNMLEIEDQVYDLLKADKTMKVMYRVTPVFDGSNLVADGVLMECLSLDEAQSLSFCVFIYNVQDGITIDYSNGESRISGGIPNKNHFFFIFPSQFEHNSLLYCTHKDKKSKKL